MDKTHPNPWIYFWLRPRDVTREFIDKGGSSIIFWFVALFGLLQVIPNITVFHQIYPTIPFAYFIIMLPLISALFSIFMLYLLSWLYTTAGRYLGGVADFSEVKYAFGLCFYPFCIVNIFVVIAFYTSGMMWVMVVSNLLALVLSFWGMVLLWNALAEAHRFSFWRGLATYMIAILLLVLIFLVILLIYNLFLKI